MPLDRRAFIAASSLALLPAVPVGPRSHKLRWYRNTGGFQCDGSGNGIETRTHGSGHWSAIWVTASASDTSGTWVTGEQGHPYLQNGASAVMGPILLNPQQPMATAVTGATPGVQTTIEYRGWLSDVSDGSDLTAVVGSEITAGSVNTSAAPLIVTQSTPPPPWLSPGMWDGSALGPGSQTFSIDLTKTGITNVLPAFLTLSYYLFSIHGSVSLAGAAAGTWQTTFVLPQIQFETFQNGAPRDWSFSGVQLPVSAGLDFDVTTAYAGPGFYVGCVVARLQ